MTENEWNYVLCKLNDGMDVKLLIDGYEVELKIVKYGISAAAVIPYINGEYKSSWLINDCEERRKFYHTITGCIGNREYHEYKAVWTSIRLMRIHFERQNKEIELLDS